MTVSFSRELKNAIYVYRIIQESRM